MILSSFISTLIIAHRMGREINTNIHFPVHECCYAYLTVHFIKGLIISFKSQYLIQLFHNMYKTTSTEIPNVNSLSILQ